MQSNFEKERIRKEDREKKANLRALLNEEEKEAIREKDRLRKAAKRAAKRAALKQSQETSGKTISQNPHPKKSFHASNSVYLKNEREHNRVYKEQKRKGQTQGEAEYERIENLLIKRKSRAARSQTEKELDKQKARDGMKFERILPFKKRRPKGQREEYMWWQFWKKSYDNKELIRKKLPKYAEKFEEWEAKCQNPYEEDGEKEATRVGMTAREKIDEKNRKDKLERKNAKEEPINIKTEIISYMGRGG